MTENIFLLVYGFLAGCASTIVVAVIFGIVSLSKNSDFRKREKEKRTAMREVGEKLAVVENAFTSHKLGKMNREEFLSKGADLLQDANRTLGEAVGVLESYYVKYAEKFIQEHWNMLEPIAAWKVENGSYFAQPQYPSPPPPPPPLAQSGEFGPTEQERAAVAGFAAAAGFSEYKTTPPDHTEPPLQTAESDEDDLTGLDDDSIPSDESGLFEPRENTAGRGNAASDEADASSGEESKISTAESNFFGLPDDDYADEDPSLLRTQIFSRSDLPLNNQKPETPPESLEVTEETISFESPANQQKKEMHFSSSSEEEDKGDRKKKGGKKDQDADVTGDDVMKRMDDFFGSGE